MNFNFHKPFNYDIAKRILRIAYPIIFANMSRAIMGLVDMLMVSRLGYKSIAAVGLGEMIVFCIIASIGISFMTSSQTLTSRRYGEDNFTDCGNTLFNGQLLGLCFSIPIAVIGFIYCKYLIEFILNDPETIKECIKYTSIQFIGISFPIGTFIFRGFFTGIQKTSIYLKVVLLSNIINIYLNFALIFGSENIHNYFTSVNISYIKYIGLLWTIFPYPELGIKGAALGTVFSSFIAFLVYQLYYFSKPFYKFRPQNIKINYLNLANHFKLSWPIIKREGSVMFAELFFLSIIGKIGTLQLAASNIAIKIYLIAIMPAFGVGSASGSIVGYYLGRNEPKKSILAFKDGLRYSFIIMGSFGLCFLLFPLQILNLFTENLNLIKIGVPLIRFLTIFCILDAIVVILECGLEGAGDVRFTSNMTQIHIWLITIPLIYITGYLLNLGIWGPWCSWLIGLLFMLFILINRIKNEKWTNINV